MISQIICCFKTKGNLLCSLILKINPISGILQSNMLAKVIKYCPIFLSALIFSACDSKDAYFDKYAKANRSDIVDALVDTSRKSKNVKKESVVAPIPKISNMLSFPKPPEFSQGNQIISFSVTDDINLKDVLIELGRVTGLDVDIDPTITGGVIINAKNRPLIEIIDRICKLGGLRYSFENGILSFKKDSAYSKHYVVDYLFDGGLWDEVSTNITSILNNATAGQGSAVSVNKLAGIVTIFSNDVGQKEVEKYLEEVKKNASAQVLIEAKVVEVTLNDKYNAGIDWTLVDGANTYRSTPIPGSDTSPFSIAISGASGVLGANNVSAQLKALEEFGNVRAISSPRVSALNNKKATLDFVDKLVYFTLETETNTTNSTVSNTTNTITATKNEEPVGVQLEITPSINIKDNEITLAVKPKLSIKSGDAVDPSVNPQTGASLGNKVPIIQTRELETTLKIKNGDTLVIGGLMKEDSTNTDKGLPFLSRIPVLGYLFKYVSKETKVVETVIFIKATIVNSASGVSKFDKEFHNRFSTDKRPYF